jgi:ABC-type nitrate/sulfonate/bicarbonate transport system substrate-binding protein
MIINIYYLLIKNSRMKKYFILILIIFFSFTQNSIAENKKLIFGSSIANGFLPIIAENEGYFKQVGINVELKRVTTGKIAADALISGDFDACIVIDSNINYLGFSDSSLRVVAELGERLVDTIVFNKNSGIINPIDLKGKKIGYGPGTASHIFLARFLEKNNIPWDSIKPISIQPQAIETAFKNGIIDAVSTFPPWSTNLEISLGENAKSFKNDNTIYPSKLFLATTEKTLNTRKTEIKNLLESFKLASEFYKKNPTKTITYLAKDIGVPEDKVIKVLEPFNYTFKNDPNSILFIYELGQWTKNTHDNFRNLPLPDFKKYFLLDSLN